MASRAPSSRVLSDASPSLNARLRGFARAARWFVRSFQLEGSYLRESGFLDSLERGHPALPGGAPAPWMNHAFVRFVAPRVEGLRVLEWGSGYSTAFWATHAASVHAVEHDTAWFDDVRGLLAPYPNADVRLVTDRAAYIAAVRDAEADVVVVDGKERGNCLFTAAEVLPPQAVIVVDDSHYPYLARAIAQAVDAHGYKVLSITGPKARDTGLFETSVLYHTPNVLGL